MCRSMLLLMLLITAPPACAEDLLPVLVFSGHGAHALTEALPDTGGPVSGLSDADALALKLHEQRDAMRERLLDALGLAPYLPRGHFSTLGYDTRWSLNLHTDRSVTLNLGVRW